MICHIAFESDYSFALHNLLLKHFDINEHIFLICGRASWDSTKQFQYRNSVKVADLNSQEVRRLLCESEQIIIHGLFFGEVVDYFHRNQDLLPKTSWKLWGGDLYCYRNAGTTDFPAEYEEKRRQVIRNFGRIICVLEEDYQLARQVYDTKATRAHGFYPLLLNYDYLDSLRKPRAPSEIITVQVGNSATRENCHEEAFEHLIHLDNDNMRVCCPLSYGDKSYGNEIIRLGMKLFGSRFCPLTDVLPFKEYSDHLSSVDVAVMNHNRQQGLGNTVALLYLGRKVYMRHDTTSYSWLMKHGITVYDMRNLGHASFAEFSHIEEDVAARNTEIIGREFSDDACVKLWKSIFSSKGRQSKMTVPNEKGSLIQKLKHQYFPGSNFVGPYEQNGHAPSIYEEQWLWAHRHLIKGTVLDMSTPRYWHEFIHTMESVSRVVISEMGCDTVTKYGKSSSVDIVADFCDPNLPVAPETFDTILCLSILEHCTNPLSMVNNLYKLLRPGGTVFFWAPFAYIDGHLEPDYWRFGRDGFRLLVKQAGFEIMEEGNFGDLGKYFLQEFGFDASARNGHRGVPCANWIICKKPQDTRTLPKPTHGISTSAGNSPLRLYAGDIPNRPEYEGWLGLSLTQENDRHIRHDITRPLPFADNSVDAFQAEDVLEHIAYDRIVPVLNEIHRVLKPGAVFRLSVPDYRCDILDARTEKDATGAPVFDPGGGGTRENPGHAWFPRYETVKTLVEKSNFGTAGEISFLHYYDEHNLPAMREIDYAKGFIQRPPDHDPRVQTPYRPMSLVVDLTKRDVRIFSSFNNSASHANTNVGGTDAHSIAETASRILQAGEKLYSEGYTADAEGCFNALLVMQEPLATAHNNLGVIHQGRHELDNALEHFRSALALMPSHREARENIKATLSSESIYPYEGNRSRSNHYNEDYFNWQKNIGAFGGRANLFKFSEFITPSDTILDFGCGEGYLLSNITCARKIGVELNEAARRTAWAQGVEAFASPEEIPFGTADLVISNHALEHVLSPLETLQALIKTLKPGGMTVFVVPHQDTREEYNPDDINMHLYTWNQLTLGNLFRQAGFSVERVEAIQHQWPPNFAEVYAQVGEAEFHRICRQTAIQNNNYQIRIVARRK